MTTKYFFEKKRVEFVEYFNTKRVSSTIERKFIASFNSYIKDNQQSFVDFWTFISLNKSLPFEKVIATVNDILINKKDGYKVLRFVADWSHSHLGQGEILALLINENSYSGGRRYPDILFNESDRRIEVKAFDKNFRLTESTYFFTDLGTIIQALVQGGFLTSLTDINNNELRKGLRFFCESFMSPRGYIELNGRVWKLHNSSNDTMTFKADPSISRNVVNYSIVRNSLRNWLSRGLLSVKLINIVDPTRKTKVTKKELHEYVANILGMNELIPIPLEQYFSLCGLESILLYEKKHDSEPFQIINYNDLSMFTIDRVGQSKVSYKKK